MRHTIIEILTTFTSSEIKGFRKFLHSPYFNTSKKLVELNDALTKFYPEFKNKNLSKERIYVKLHSKSRYNPFYMNVLLSKLEHLAEKFVKQRAYELSKEWDFVFVLDELCRRNSDKLYTRMLKRTEQKNPSYKDSDGDFFWREYFLERLKYNFSAAKGKIPGKKALYR